MSMETILVKINVRKKARTNADVYRLRDSSIDKVCNICLGVSSMPDKEFVRWKLAEYLGHNNFKMEVL